MSNNQFNLFFDTELNEGVKVVTLSSVFFSDDDEAHSFIVRTTREGQPVSLEGATVRGYFIRPDNVTIELDGTVNEEGCVVVTLNDACYRKKGRFQLAIRSTLDDVISTIFCCDGGVKPSSSDSYVADETIVPSFAEILAKIEAMEEATAAANEAAERANEAAENAGNAGGGTSGPVTWNQVTGKPSAFTPVAHSHTQSEVSGLTEALAGKADAKHTHDYPVKSVNGMTGDVVIRTGGGGTGEGLPEVTVSDNGMPLVVKNGEWSVGKLEKNAVTGLVTDIIEIYSALGEKADNEHEHAWSEITGKPGTFTPTAHSHTQSDVNGLMDALDGKAPIDHTHDYPVKSVNGMTGDVVIQAGGGTDERIPQPTEADDGMPLRVENGEYKVGKLQKNAVEGLVTDFIDIYGLFDAKDAAIAEKADKDHTHAYSAITGKPDTFTPSAHSHAQSDVSGLTDALNGKAPKDHTHAWSEITNKPTVFPPEAHTHDYPVKSVNGMTGDVVIATGGGTDERIPQPTEADDGMPLRVENGEYKVGKLQKNAVEGLVTDLIMYGESLAGKAPENHADESAKYGMANYENFGHVKLIQFPLTADETGENWLDEMTGEVVATNEDLFNGTTGLAASAFAISAFYMIMNTVAQDHDYQLEMIAQSLKSLQNRVTALENK